MSIVELKRFFKITQKKGCSKNETAL